jgi:hypothetical protein
MSQSNCMSDRPRALSEPACECSWSARLCVDVVTGWSVVVVRRGCGGGGVTSAADLHLCRLVCEIDNLRHAVVQS